MPLMFDTLLKIIVLPVFVFGFANNFLPFWFAESRVKKIKDTQFHSSFKYVVGMIAFPLWYLIIAGILALVQLPFWIILLYLVLLPGTGLFAYGYLLGVKKLIMRWRFLLGGNQPRIKELVGLRTAILEEVQNIINRYRPVDGN
jgi:hypothetical protein